MSEKPYLELPQLKLSVGMASFDPADVREMRDKYEARIRELEDPFRSRADEVTDCVLTHSEIQGAIASGNLRVAAASGIGTEFECGPGFVSVHYANEVISERCARLEMSAHDAHVAASEALARAEVAEARIRELESLPDQRAALELIRVLDAGELPKGNSLVESAVKRRIRELTEWRPMDTAPWDAPRMNVRDDTKVVFLLGHSGSYVGWLPLPEVSRG